MMNILIAAKDVPEIRQIQLEAEQYISTEKQEQIFIEWDSSQVGNIIKNHSIDLVFCEAEAADDPIIQTLETIKEKGSFGRLIILAKNPDTSLLKKVLNMNCIGFMEKPLQNKEIAKLLEIAGKDFETHKKYAEMKEENRFWKSHEKTIKNQFWTRYLNGKMALDPIEFIQEARSCGILIGLKDTFHLAVLSRKLVQQRSETVEVKTRGQLMEAADGCISRYTENYITVNQKRPVLIAWNLKTADFLSACNGLIMEMECKYHMPVCCYYETELYCEQIFLGACEAMTVEKESMVEKTGCYCARSFSGGKGKECEPVIPSHTEELLKNGQYVQFEQAIRLDLAERARQKTISGSFLKSLKQDVMQLVYCVMWDKSIPAHTLEITEEVADMYENAHISVYSFQDWLGNFLKAMPENKRTITAADAIKRYIHQNLGEELSRERLAEAFFMSPDYLGKLFKKETGESLGNYIAAEKMKRAGELLASTDKPVGEIAAELGYGNFSYFSKSFKKYTGMTPMEYRSQKVTNNI